MLKFVIETLKEVLWADVTFSWFADVHAFVAVQEKLRSYSECIGWRREL